MRCYLQREHRLIVVVRAQNLGIFTMKNLISALILCISYFHISAVFAQNTQETNEPHKHEDHAYIGSIYKNEELITLPQAIQKAMDTSPRITASNAKLDAAKAEEKQAAYWNNPKLGLEVENFSGTGDFNGTDNAEYTLSINHTLEIGGKRAARKESAKAIKNAVSTDVLIEKLNIERDVHLAYSEVLAKAEGVKLAIEQEDLAKKILETVVRRVSAAAEPEIQQSKAEVAYETSVIARELETQQLYTAKSNLSRLWGEPALNLSLDHSHFFDLESPEKLVFYQEKLKDIPDIQKLAFLKLEKESLLKLEKSKVIPDPDFSLGVRNYRETGDQALIFEVSVPLPFFNRNGGNISKARSQITQVEYESRQIVLLLEQEVMSSWQQWVSSFTKADRLKRKLIPAAKKAFQLANSGYEKGKFSYLEVLDAQRTLFDARTQYHDALKHYHHSRANLERLTNSITY